MGGQPFDVEADRLEDPGEQAVLLIAIAAAAALDQLGIDCLRRNVDAAVVQIAGDLTGAASDVEGGTVGSDLFGEAVEEVAVERIRRGPPSREF